MTKSKLTIEVIEASQNNLKNISVSLPVDEITVFTGVSGSGKSSLVFGVLAAESQRQLNFTFPSYLRNRLPQSGTPHVRHISGLSTAIIVDQKPIGTNSRSTVGTATDASPLLRLIFSRVGKPWAGYSPAFSFNDASGMCPACQGSGEVYDIDESELIDMSKSINEGAFNFKAYQPGSWYWKWYKRTGLFDADKKLQDYTQQELELLLHAEPAPLKNPPAGWYATAKYEGIVHRFRHMFIDNISQGMQKRFHDELQRIIHKMTCPLCAGARLNQAALACKIDGQNIAQLSDLPVRRLADIVSEWQSPDILPAVENLLLLLRTMIDLGLGYMQLSRTTPTLSGGEAQRIKMVRHLGSSLTRFTYIFDEPSTGLHPLEVQHFGKILRKLCDKGNTVLIVEHDPDLITLADHIVDMGPGSGSEGGNVLFSGPYPQFLRSCTPTAASMTAPRHFRTAREPQQIALAIKDLNVNNLKNINVEIYQGILTVLTGVAGSGKSTLVKALIHRYPHIRYLDQSPLHGSIRSTVATYLDIMDRIRTHFAKANGVARAWFSAASKGGCEVCKGKGIRTSELAFLGNAESECEACNGSGYNPTALSYLYRGSSIDQVMALTVSQALTFFADDTSITQPLLRMEQVGTGYLTIGRATSTLSGGERQRVKLSMVMAQQEAILILDEPTTGLHGQDVSHFLALIQQLVDSGTTVIMVEHNLDVMLSADWLIDLGPGAGDEGGEIVYRGQADAIVDCTRSLTGKALRRYLHESH